MKQKKLNLILNLMFSYENFNGADISGSIRKHRKENRVLVRGIGNALLCFSHLLMLFSSKWKMSWLKMVVISVEQQIESLIVSQMAI